MKILRKAWTIANTIANNIAVQKLATKNPVTRCEASNTSTALIMKVNRPRLKILIGRVRMTRIGRRIILMRPRTTATMRAVPKPETTTPGNRYAVTAMAMA